MRLETFYPVRDISWPSNTQECFSFKWKDTRFRDKGALKNLASPAIALGGLGWPCTLQVPALVLKVTPGHTARRAWILEHLQDHPGRLGLICQLLSPQIHLGSLGEKPRDCGEGLKRVSRYQKNVITSRSLVIGAGRQRAVLG